MYDPMMVEPMRQEAVAAGCEETRSPEEVHRAVKEGAGSLLIFVNSVCGCAAGGARPGLNLALAGDKKPDRAITVFAGNDREATMAARQYFQPYQPSSPQIGLLKDGKLVFMMQRHDIEGRMPQQVAADLQKAFAEHC
jgi:putative YphP/YqiW family bacilliredoxin